MSTNHVSVRLDAETIARVDALAPQLSTHWRPATRSDVLRALILTALAGHETSTALVATRGASTGRGEGRGPREKSERPRR